MWLGSVRKGGKSGRPQPIGEQLCIPSQRVWPGPIDSREPSRICKQGNDMLKCAFQRGHSGNSEER